MQDLAGLSLALANTLILQEEYGIVSDLGRFSTERWLPAAWGERLKEAGSITATRSSRYAV